MSVEPAFEPKPWLVKQILDPEIEKEASFSVVQMLVEYDPASVAHIIFSNHTWDDDSLQKYIKFYQKLPATVVEDIRIVSRNCDPVHFQTFIEKHSINHLPIYTKAVDMSTIDAKCHSRTFPDPSEYLANGSASTEELFAFVCGVMSDVLDVMFSPREIKKMLVDLKIIESLENCHNRDDEIGKDVDKKFEYDVMKTMRTVEVSLPQYLTRMSHSITHFLVFFALHTIRENCYVSFGVDRQIKFYQREMHQKAVEDNRNAKSRAFSGSSVKKEKMTLGVKREKRVSSSDDDIEIIDDSLPSQPKLSKPAKSNGESSSGSANNSIVDPDDYPEREMLMSLEKESLPMVFKSKFRKLVEQNRDMRDEIKDYKNLIQIFIKEKSQKLN